MGPPWRADPAVFSMPPKFIYFDLGQVLLHFDRQRQCQQMAEVAGCSPEVVHRVVFDDGLHWKYEAGELTSQQFYEAFCRQTDTRPPLEALLHANSDIFRMNPTIAALVAALEGAGHRLGVLSNTCESHWNLVTHGRYGILPGAFKQFVLSYEVGASKPDERIFRVPSGRCSNSICKSPSSTRICSTLRPLWAFTMRARTSPGVKSHSRKIVSMS